jgi:hypothetical protein
MMQLGLVGRVAIVTGGGGGIGSADDLSAATAELEERDVTIVWREKELAPGWRSTAIRDMDGNLINVFQRHAE